MLVVKYQNPFKCELQTTLKGDWPMVAKLYNLWCSNLLEHPHILVYLFFIHVLKFLWLYKNLI